MNNFQSWGDPTIFIFRGGIGMLGDLLLRNRRQIWLLVLREFERANLFLFSLKPQKNHRFSDYFRGTEVN